MPKANVTNNSTNHSQGTNPKTGVNGGMMGSTPLHHLNNVVQKKVTETIDKTKEEMSNIQKKLHEYDERYQATETAKKQTERASEFLHKALEDTKSYLETLRQNTKSLYDQGSEIPMKAITLTLAKLSQALEELKTLAKKYDEKYKVTEGVTSIVEPARARAATYLAEISTYITNVSQATYAQLQGVNDGLKGKIMELTGTGMKFMINTAASLDNKFDIETKIKNFDEKFKVTKNIKELDEKYKVKEKTEGLLEKAVMKGKELDVKLTDGKAAAYIEEAYSSGLKMVSDGLEKLQKDFDMAKRESRENLTEAK